MIRYYLFLGLWIIVLQGYGQANTATIPSQTDTLATFSIVNPADSSNSMVKMDSLPIKKNLKSTALLLGSSLVLFGGTGYFLQNAWWAEEATAFHFDNGADLKYALNLDKASHAFGGALVADLYTRAFLGTKMPIKKAVWYGTGMGILGQMVIEIKDGFAPRWGFSVLDVLSGSAGAFYNMGKYQSNFLANTDLKVSYWQRSTKYFEKSHKRVKAFSIDDYLNQTYWFTIYPKAIFGSKTKLDWLGVSIGNGIEPDFWDGAGLGRHELYIAPDISLERLFKPKNKFLKQVLHFTNYIKFPMPTLQVYPQTKLWWLFL